jgi:hypothetical protein
MNKTYFSRLSLSTLAIAMIAGNLSSEAIAQPDLPPIPSVCALNAAEVISYTPAKRKDGSVLPTQFMQVENALGTPSDLDNPGPINYVSLGFGGEITLRLSDALADADGDDFRIVETTYNSKCKRYPERAEVYVSQDGCNFVCLGITCHDGSFDLAGTGLSWIRYVKIHDVSPVDHPFSGDNQANGYDVDGIQCLHGIVANDPQMNTEFLVGAPRTYENFIPVNPSTIAAARLNPMSATGFPQGGNGNPVTFTSLGFGGEITLVFDYIVFDKEGPDLQVTETSGSANYPERAQFFGSACGSDWVDLTTTEDGVTLYQDGWIDFNGSLYGLKYLRIVDRSARSQFGTGADGYDVDGVVAINAGNCSSAPGVTKLADTEYGVIDEPTLAEVYPNPFSDVVRVNHLGTSDQDVLNIRVFTVTGQLVYTDNLIATYGVRVEKAMNLNFLPQGSYMIELKSEAGTITRKVVKF